ncbi:MAG: septum formation initiator family protein [Candidatus Moraniibacteriota bacterium]
MLAKLILLVFIVAAGFAFSSGWKEMQRSKKIEDDVTKLQQEAKRVQDENKALSERIDFFSTDSSVEREAKAKLGMKKQGEEAVSVELDPEAVAEKATSVSAESDPTVGNSGSNFRKWLSYFNFR